MGTVANILQEEGYNVVSDVTRVISDRLFQTLLLPLIDFTLNDTIPIVQKIKYSIKVDIAPRYHLCFISRRKN